MPTVAGNEGNKMPYILRSSYRRYLSDALENSGSRNTRDIAASVAKGDLTVEHIMPQKLTEVGVKSWDLIINVSTTRGRTGSVTLPLRATTLHIPILLLNGRKLCSKALIPPISAKLRC